MFNPSGIKHGPLKIVKTKDGIFSVENAYEGDFDYYKQEGGQSDEPRHEFENEPPPPRE